MSVPIFSAPALAKPGRSGLSTPWVVLLTFIITGLVATIIVLMMSRNGSSSTRPTTHSVVKDPVVTGPNPSSWIVPGLPQPDQEGWIHVFDGERLYGLNPTNALVTAGLIARRDGMLWLDAGGGEYNGGARVRWKGSNVAIRVQGKKVSGQNFVIGAGHYSALYDGNGWVSIGHSLQGKYQDIKVVRLPSIPAEFSSMEFRIRDATLSVMIEGNLALEAEAPVIEEFGQIGVSTYKGASLFKRIEFRELKAENPPAQEVASGPPPIGIQWERTFGGSDQDEALAIEETKDGGYIVVGSSASPISGTKTSQSFGKADWWMFKLNAKGEKIWEKTYGGHEWEVARAVVEVEDGFLITGPTDSNADGNKSVSSLGKRDIWLIKTDRQGEKQWEKSLGGTDADAAWSVYSVAPDRFYLIGLSASPMGPGKRSASFGGTDYWLQAMDRSGKLLWDRSYGGDKYEMAFDMAITRDGGGLLIGESSSGPSGSKTSGFYGGNSDAWVVRVDSKGEELWQRSLGGAGVDQLRAAIPLGDHGFLAVGNSQSPPGGSITSPSQGGADVWLLRLDEKGNTVWERRYGGTENDMGSVVVKSPSGGVLCLAASNSGRSGNKTSPGYGRQDAWLLRLDDTGNKLWETTLGGSHDDRCWSLKPTRDGGYILCGSSASPPGKAKSAPHYGGHDAWIIKLAPEGNANGADSSVTSLLNGRDLSAFYTWTKDDGVGRDPQGVFSYENGMLRISGQQRGYLATRTNYSNFRLVAEYKWGNVGTNYDSGIWVHAIGPDTDWMHGVECNIKSIGTGDAGMYPKVTIKSDGSKETDPGRYTVVKRPKRTDPPIANPVGQWNTMEVVCEGGRVRVFVNSRLVSEGTDALPNSGKINLQSYAGEIFFRRLDLHPLQGFSASPSE